MTSLDLQGDFINDEPICHWASIFTKIPWVIKYTVNYGPIHEWACILFVNILWIIKYTINHRPICEWVSVSVINIWEKSQKNHTQ